MVEVEPVLQIRTKNLRRQYTPEEYQLYRAALEWGLVHPCVIASESELISEPRWRGRVDPCAHNFTNLITFCSRLPGTLFADEVGLDHSISAGLVASELIARARISKLLVVCPKFLAPEWCDMLGSKFHIPAQIAVGRDLMYAETKDVGAVITTHHSAWLYLNQIPNDRFDMLVIDGADKLRHMKLHNVGSVDQSAQVASSFRATLERRRFRLVLMMAARPIRSSFWDFYHLVDLQAAARGHANPFGNENTFVEKFVADDPVQARQLKLEALNEFRTIASRYMTRFRREDVRLNFPNRLVQSLDAEPNAKELELIKIVAGAIGKLKPTAQIRLLFALTSSPNAVLAQVTAMARDSIVSEDLVTAVREIINRMPLSGKLEGLTTIINRLRLTDPERWRVVIFTGSVETQKRIYNYLELRQIPVSTINSLSNPQDQDALARFRKFQREIPVIICTDTEEVLDLPLAASVVNYDLPWDPVIAERRIGQFQKLGSNRARLNIFNILLRGTFEQYVVGRLVGRLLLSSRAIVDIEPLLHAAGILDDDDADVAFEEKLLRLVLASLTGEDVESTTRQMEDNLVAAKVTLEREEQNVDAVLGSLHGAEQLRQRAPRLPPLIHSMEADDFAQQALNSLGVGLTEQKGRIYLSEHDGARELIRFDGEETAADTSAVLYAPGSGAFSRLAGQVSANGLHLVDDLDHQADKQADEIARRWVSEFGATFVSAVLLDVRRAFDGSVLVQLRASIAHDNYARLLDISCGGDEHNAWTGRTGLEAVSGDIPDGTSVGVNSQLLFEAAKKDPAMAEFCRFYSERRREEVSAGGDDAAKRQLRDDFTPKFELTLAGLRGVVRRQLKLRVQYKWADDSKYSSTIVVAPGFGTVIEAPSFERCAQTGQVVPVDCLERCELTGLKAIKHELVQSHISGRFALIENALMCTLSEQRILLDEAEISDATGQVVARSLLKRSAISGRLAEPNQVAQCEFTQLEALHSELGISDISGKCYRLDEGLRSVVSGKVGHRSEFVTCDVTQKPFVPGEGENCEVTGQLVDPNILEQCSISGKIVVPSELERCAASGKLALKKYLVTGSVSGGRLLERYALRSIKGKFCSPLEGKRCMWSSRNCHPDDLRTCTLTGVQVYFKYVTSDADPRLQPLLDLLYGVRRTGDASNLWETIAAKGSVALGGGRCRLEAAQTSPDGRHLAVCSEVRGFFGISVHKAGFLYSFDGDQIVGRIALGRRSPTGWVSEKILDQRSALHKFSRSA